MTAMEEDAPPRRRTGRPLSFDREEALGQALDLFWRHGYEATSLAELTRAMGVTPPSLYAAFGSKKGLFREAVARYLARPRPPAEMVARAGSATEAARWLLEGAAAAFAGEGTPPGCLLASAAIAVSAEAEDVRRELAGIRLGVEAALRERILADVAAGALPAGTDAATLAAYVTAVVQGMSTLARDGAGREVLLAVARHALLAWPGAPDCGGRAVAGRRDGMP